MRAPRGEGVRRSRAKVQLRREMKVRLEAVGETERREAARRLKENVLRLPEVSGSRRVFTCLSFGLEIDTWGLVGRLLDEGKEVFVPRTEPGDPRIHVHRYPCSLRTLSFGLRQPTADAPEVPPETLDEVLEVALVLGLAFDRRGFRLGYGGGYFDRFLQARPFPAVGLAFSFQILDHLPAEAHDVPMHGLVTDSHAVRVRQDDLPSEPGSAGRDPTGTEDVSSEAGENVRSRNQ